MIQKQKKEKDKNYNSSVRIVLELGQNDMWLAKNLEESGFSIFFFFFFYKSCFLEIIH